MTKLLNFAAFQLCWFANVLGAANGLPWLGPLCVVVWLAVHFALLRAAAGADVSVLAGAALFGWLADSGQVLAGFISFPDAARLGAPTTLWMVALWVGFAATLRHSLGWLRQRYWLGALLGAIGGALSYRAGEMLGAIDLAGTGALLSVALQFAIATPLLLWVAGSAAHGANTPASGVANSSRS